MTRTTPAKATAAKTSRYIAVEGVIGVGKTTLAKRIGKSLAASVGPQTRSLLPGACYHVVQPGKHGIEKRGEALIPLHGRWQCP